MSFEELEEAARAAEVRARCPQRVVPVVDADTYSGNWAKARARADKDEMHRALAEYFEDYRALLHGKVLDQVGDDAVLKLEALHDFFPNLADAVTELKGAVCRGLMRRNRELPEFKLLLVGAPGLGKTAFVEAAAAALGRRCHRISLSGKSASFELKGLGRQWMNASPGAIARIFAGSPSANPIIILDEIDKGRDQHSSWGRSQDVVLELAEPVNARHFRDEYLEIDIDTSNAIVVATANDTDSLSEALKSRFRIIEIGHPTAQQNRGIIRQIYSELIRDDHVYDSCLSEDVVRLLDAMTPRSARMQLINALGVAAYRTYKQFGSTRETIAIRPEDIGNRVGSAPKRRIGFVSEP